MPQPHNFHPSVLREYDIRGIVGDTLSEADALAIGLSFGTTLIRGGGKTVVTGYDGRLSSPALHGAVVDGLRQSGCDVITVGIGPTPMIHFAGHHLKTDAALMVTGSHNPANYNGFKFSLFHKPFYGQSIIDLGAQAARADWTTGSGKHEIADVSDAYVDRLMKDFEGGRALNIVWDAGNGAAGDILNKLVKKLPGQHIILFGDIDGTFPNHHPDPTVDANLAALREKIVETGSDLGIAFDGDGDRIGCVDEHGTVIRSDMLLALYAAEIIETKPGATIIGDVKCSGAMFAEIHRLGGNPVVWKTGHSLIKAKMAETGAPLAGELSGHIFFADKYYGFDDAQYCAVRIINILGRSDKTMSGLLAHLPKLLGTPEIRIDVADEKKFAVVDRMKASLAKAFEGEDYRMTDIDGIRLDGPAGTGWLLVRPSNTQPALVARIEAQTPEILELLENRLKAALQEEGLGLPLENNH